MDAFASGLPPGADRMFAPDFQKALVRFGYLNADAADFLFTALADEEEALLLSDLCAQRSRRTAHVVLQAEEAMQAHTRARDYDE